MRLVRFTSSMRGLLVQFVFMCFVLNAIYAQQNPIDFLPGFIRSNYNDYGFKPFIPYGENQQRLEYFNINDDKKIVFMEYLLVNKSSSDTIDSYFTFRDVLWSFESTGPEPIDRAVINLGFWGINPIENRYPGYAKVNDVSGLSIHTLFVNVLSEFPGYFAPQHKYSDLHLLIVNIHPKDSEHYRYFKSQLTILHSMFIYILWDKGIEPELPDFINASECIDLIIPDSILFDSSLVTVMINELPFPLNYKVLDHSNNSKAYNKKFTKLEYSLNSKSTEIGYPRRLVIEKPWGYNIYRAGESDTSKWLSNVIEIDLSRPERIMLSAEKLTPFYFVYIDPSGFHNTKRLIKTVQSRMQNISKAPYFLFVSHPNKSLIAEKGDDYKDVVQRIADFNIDTPIPSVDLERIQGAFNANSIAERTSLQFHLFLSKNFYDFSFDNLISSLVAGLDKEILGQSVYLEYDEAFKRKDIRYFDITKPLKFEK